VGRDAGEQREMLAELVRQAQVKTIVCACGKFQFILAAQTQGRGED
jgi:hypothetical protein